MIATDASFGSCFLLAVASSAAVEIMAAARQSEQHLCRKRHRANLGRRRTPPRFSITQELPTHLMQFRIVRTARGEVHDDNFSAAFIYLRQTRRRRFPTNMNQLKHTLARLREDATVGEPFPSVRPTFRGGALGARRFVC